MPSKEADAKAGASKSGSSAKPRPAASRAKKVESVQVASKPKPSSQATVKPTPPIPVSKPEASKETTTPVVLGASPDTRKLVIRIASVVVAVLVVVVIVFGVMIYAYKSDNSVVKDVADVVPYPAERVNGQFVPYSDYLFEVDANVRAYQNNAKLNNQPAVDFNSTTGKKLLVQIKQHALQTIESDALVDQLASQMKVTVTNSQVDNLVNQLYARYGGKDTLLKTLNQIYGWNLNDLRSVVRKQLLAQNLQQKVTSDPSVAAAAKAKAEDVLSQIKAGGDFSTLAKKYSQASDASTGGDLGYFTKGQLPDNEEAAAEALQPGDVSDVIQTQYGYEILKVLDKKADGSIHAQHILIKTVDFNEYFQAQLNKAKVNTYIKV